jgi:hypothetical protein
VERFHAIHGRPLHPVPDALRSRALAQLSHRHDLAVEESEIAHKEIGAPDRVTATYARDLICRARDRRLIDATQRPLAFDPDRGAPAAVSNLHAKQALTLPLVGKPELVTSQRNLRQADRGMEREVAELRVLRAAAELPRDHPRRLAFEKRFSTLAEKQARRAAYRGIWLADILAQIRAKARAGVESCDVTSVSALNTSEAPATFTVSDGEARTSSL